MTLEKGAMVFHMLRWEMGDDAFTKFLRDLLSSYTDKCVRARDLESIAEDQAPSPGPRQLPARPLLRPMGRRHRRPAVHRQVHRLPPRQQQGLPHRRRDHRRTSTSSACPSSSASRPTARPKTRRVDVSGTDSSYSVETFGRPRRITIDPQTWLLKIAPPTSPSASPSCAASNSSRQGDLTGALVEYQKALDANKNSSLASLPHRRNLLHAAQLPVRRQQLPRRPPRRRRPQLDRGLEPHPARPHLRRHRPARARRQRVPPRRPDQRQHPGRRQRSPQPHDPPLHPRPR